ncbi:MAG: tellurite resistance/C4-dicarboxylate transporter family protein [Chloroflexi bacterium]|nr:tellurite resistance/C4-dicarboxylate transporter family protein [Chloroflexota bacterium]
MATPPHPAPDDASVRAGSPLLAAIREEVRGFPPAYFALVMATGIVSIAANLLDMWPIAVVLFWLNVVAYVLLWLLNLLRAIWHTHQFSLDLVDHNRGPGFFTVVAATSVLGTQLVLIFESYAVATALWFLAVILWVLFTYIIFTGLTVKANKPTLAQGINGGWLLAVVATQSIVVLSAHLASSFGPYRLATNFFALSMWLWGGMLYIWMISLIFYRYTFFTFAPDDLTPPYWINMGAMAISALAGDVLIINTPHAPFLREILPFFRGFTVFFWATGTWWIPMLAILAIWRYVFRRFPLRYDPLYWGAVFPLGMYTVSTFQMARAMELEFLYALPHFLVYLVLFVWLVTFIGLLRRLASRLATVRATARRPS